MERYLLQHDNLYGHQEEETRNKRKMEVTKPSINGARSESRTRTPVRAVDFESTASTYSAIRAHARLRSIDVLTIASHSLRINNEIERVSYLVRLHL